MEYNQVEVYTTTEGVEPVGAVLMELDAGGYVVQDAADFEEFLQGKSGRWDYIDDGLMKLRLAETTLTVYLPVSEAGAGQLCALERSLARLRAMDSDGLWGRLELGVRAVHEQDWAEAWKRHYHPVRVGERLTIRPSWEEYAPAPGEVVLSMDPGMAFGTGTHESTRLCLRLLERQLRPGMAVLDVGCGSGILAVAALLLGAGSAVGVDIDEVAVRVAQENAARNGVASRARFLCGSLARQVQGGYDIVLANIVADVIIGFVPDIPRVLAPGGALIASGIIDSREADVRAALEAGGFTIVCRETAGGWVALQAVCNG